MSTPNSPMTAGARQSAAEGLANQNSTLLAAIEEVRGDLEYQRKMINELIDQLAPIVGPSPPTNVEENEKTEPAAVGTSVVHSALQTLRVHAQSNTEAIVRLAEKVEV